MSIIASVLKGELKFCIKMKLMLFEFQVTILENGCENLAVSYELIR